MKKEVRYAIILGLAALALALIVTLVSAARRPAEAEQPGEAAELQTGYEAEYADLLFDRSVVHTIDIQTPEEVWNGLISAASESVKEYITCDLVIDGERVEGAAIRCKGHSSLSRSKSTGKYSFKVEFDHFAEGASYHGLDKLSLNNLVADASCMHDYIVYRTMGEFGVASPLCSYAFVTVNGEDFGLYLAVEAVEDGFLRRNYGPEHGDLYKPDRTASRGRGQTGDSKLTYFGDDPASYGVIFDSAKTDATRKDQYRLIGSLRRLSEGEPERALDIDRVLRYFVVHGFVYNWDSYTGTSVHNYYLYEENGLLSMIPWDYNEAFGSGGAGVNHPIDTPILSGTVEERPMLAWIFADPACTDMYHAVYAEFLDAMCDSGWAAREFADTRALIAPYVQRDPRSFYAYESFEEGADALALFFDLRARSVRGQLDGTIPSTAEGQAADGSALIDTSALGGSGSRGSGSRGGSGEMSRSRRSNTEASGEAGERPSRRSSGEAAEATPAPSGEAAEATPAPSD